MHSFSEAENQSQQQPPPNDGLSPPGVEQVSRMSLKNERLRDTLLEQGVRLQRPLAHQSFRDPSNRPLFAFADCIWPPADCLSFLPYFGQNGQGTDRTEAVRVEPPLERPLDRRAERPVLADWVRSPTAAL